MEAMNYSILAGGKRLRPYVNVRNLSAFWRAGDRGVGTFHDCH